MPGALACPPDTSAPKPAAPPEAEQQCAGSQQDQGSDDIDPALRPSANIEIQAAGRDEAHIEHTRISKSCENHADDEIDGCDDDAPGTRRDAGR